MDFIDETFIQRISSKLDKFKKVKSGLYNFRCTYCGDSTKSKIRARGYLYSKNNNTNYKCHNCGMSLSFSNFLKDLDPNLHRDFCIEKYKSGFTGKNFVTPAPKFDFKKPTFREKVYLPKASENEKANEYLIRRKLNPNLFYYADNFSKWVNEIAYEPNLREEPRIVIPLFYHKKLIGIQGRSLEPSAIKYITIMLDPNAPKIYNYDNVNKNNIVYVLEGPFDASLLLNSVAMCGADINLKDLNIQYPVYVYDNEPRNKEIHTRMIKVIESGFPIVIWPEIIKEKDINDMILADHSVNDILIKNTYKGLEANLKFNFWKKK